MSERAVLAVPNNLRLPADLRPHQEDHRHPEPDRDPEAVLRGVPAARTSPRSRAGTRGCRRSSSPSSRSRTSTRRRRSSSSATRSASPKYDVDECHQRGMTFAAPLKVTVQLVIWDVDPESGARSIKNVKEQEVYFGEIPLMTRQRHVHDQRHRARHRLAAPPLAGRLLRPRQGQDPRQRQAPLLRAHHPVPRLVDRLRVRPERHPVRPHRPAPEVPRHRAAARARHDRPRTCSTTSTSKDTDRPRRPEGREASSSPSSWSACKATRDIRHPQTQRAHRQGRPQVHQARAPPDGGRRASSRSRSRSTRSSGASPRTTSTTRRPARCSLECNEEITDGEARRCSAQRGIDDARGPLHRRHAHRSVAPQHAAAGQDRAARKRRSSRSTGACAPAIRRRSRPRPPSSTTCSSIPSATTCRASAA